MQVQLNFRLDTELADFLKRYAKQEYTSVSQILRSLVLQLKRSIERSEQIDSPQTSTIEIK